MRILLGIDLLQGVAEQNLGPGPLAGDRVGARGQGQQVDVVNPDRESVFGHPRPQLERTLHQLGDLAVGVHALGGLGGVDAGPDGGGLIAGRRVVAGHRRRALELGVLAAVGAGLQRPGQSQVPFAALARQQIVIQRLAQERVAEAEALVTRR